MVDLPANFEVRDALGNGDCFFDSVAQGLKQVNPEFNFTPKSLREICKRFAQSQLQNDQSWLKEALKAEQELINEYVTGIEFTANDIQQESGAVNKLGLTPPIWGRSEIEGRIICAEYDVKLHVVEKHFVERKEIWTHQIVDSNGSRSVDAVDYNKEENMVHVMNTGLHFQPILKNRVQHNDHYDYNDKIKTEKGSSEVVKNLTQQNADVKKENGTVTTELADEVSKDKQEPQEGWCVKSPSTAQTKGYSYEVQLAMWFLLVGKEKVEKKEIKSFYLASGIKEEPRFDHIFKYHKEGCRSNVTFLQSKHKENETCDNGHKEEAGSGNVFDLSNAWKAYAKIKGYFSCKKTDNRIFGEEFSDVECCFIFFTNTIPNIGYKNIQEKTVEPEDILYFGKTSDCYYYRLTPSEETDKIILNYDTSSKKEDMNVFLGQLKLYFCQPNEKQLSEFIKQKIKSQYSVREDDVDLVFASVKSKIEEWFEGKRKSEFITSQNRFFEDAARVSIKFDVKEPVSLFAGRNRELENLHEILQNAGEAVISQTASVTSLGGVGKTELARKYISEHSKEYDDNVIWINAENYLSIAYSFGRVAEDKLGINILDEKGNRKKTEIIAEEVYGFFARMHRKSLFIFGNSGKYRGYEEKDEGIDKFLPSGPNKPYVLITSRDQEWGKIKTLTLNVFSEEDAVEFIRKALEDIDDLEESEVKRLAAELQYLPLALTQAVAYIRMENQALNNVEEERFTIGDYLKLFKEKTRELLCKGTSKILDRYTAAVMTTWQITIDKMKQKKLQGEQALNILNIAAYLAPDKIPVDAIFCKLVNDTVLLQPALQLLDQYSMATLLGEELDVHRLVQQVTRIELEGQGKNNEVVHHTFTLLRESLPYGKSKFDDISHKKKLMPHLEIYLSHIGHLVAKKSTDTPSIYEHSFRELLSWMADEYTDLGNPKRKQELLEKALPYFENHYGPDHPRFAATLSNLGNAHGSLGDPKKQRNFLEQALKIQKQIYRTNHYEVAKTLNDLANAYDDLGDYSNKKKLLKEALKIQEVYFGKNHLEVVKTLISLGNAYGDLGYPYKQKELLEQALKISEDHYEPDHFKVAKVLGNLGSTYGNLGDPSKGKDLLERALKIEEDHYGPNHFKVAKVLVNLGNTYGDLGNPSKRKELLERALKIEEDHYGPNHFKIASTLVNLGNTYGDLGDPSKGKELLERALKKEEDHYGPNHFKIASTLVNLGNTYGYLGNPSKRKELLERALKIEEDHYGPDHFKVAKVLRNLGSTYGDLGDPSKGKELLERALKIEEDHYGPNHFKIASTLVNLGNTYGDLGDPSKGKELLERALKIEEDHYEPDHFKVASTLVNLGSTYGGLGDPSKGKELLERALKIGEDHYGPNHFKIASTLVNLGNTYGDLGNPSKGKELLERALKIEEDHYGPNHFQVALTLVNLGGTYIHSGDPFKGKELLERALKIEEDYYGPNHIKLTTTLGNLSTTYASLGNPSKGKELLERALKILEDHYGPNHYEVAKAISNIGMTHGILGDPSKAKALFEKALGILSDHYGPNHFEVAKVLVNLGNTYISLSDPFKGIELLERALKILEDHYGPNHYEVATTLSILGGAYGVLGDHHKKKELIERALMINENHYGSNHLRVAMNLMNLGVAYGDLGDHAMKEKLVKEAFFILVKSYGSNLTAMRMVSENLG